MAQPVTNQEPQLEATPATGRSRVKAEFRYPVYDLEDSKSVAEAIRNQGGGAATADRLAGYLKYGGTKNGAFLSRIAAARLFGLIHSESGSYVPTPRALRMLAPERPGIDDHAAMAEAFKDVPLYQVLYNRYHGEPLPPEVGLRNAMETQYGIPKERTATAYRVLIDSARQAGYFEARGGEPTHLVEPAIGVPSQLTVEPAVSDEGDTPGGVEARPSAQIAQPETATQVSVFRRLQEALVEKIKEVPADDLEKIREYIQEIKTLEEIRPDDNTGTQTE